MISIFKIIGVIGLLILIYGTILVSSKNKGKEKKVYFLFITGGIFLLVYSINIGDTIFTVLQGVFILSAIWGLIKIK
jgi:glucose uptake protein GlcU